jgi:hypothetical protein
MNKSILLLALVPLLLLHVEAANAAVSSTVHDCIQSTITKDVSAFMVVQGVLQATGQNASA